jgi:hypothetical protein
MQAYRNTPSIVYKSCGPRVVVRPGWHASRGVAHTNCHAGWVTIGADDQAPLLRHGLQCVEQNIENREAHLILEPDDFPRSAADLQHNLDTLSSGAGGDQTSKTLAEFPDIDERRLLVGPDTEYHLDRSIEAFDLARKSLEAFGHRRIDNPRGPLQQASQQRRVDANHVKHALQVVRPVTSQECKPAVP